MWIIVSVDNPLQTVPKEGGVSDLRITLLAIEEILLRERIPRPSWVGTSTRC
jgi:hypothetical protein